MRGERDRVRGSGTAVLRANWLRDAVLRDGCPDTGCGLKVYQRDAFLRLPYFTSMHRYLPAFFLTYGHEVCFFAFDSDFLSIPSGHATSIFAFATVVRLF